MQDIVYVEPSARYSQATIHNGIAYLAGQVAAGPGKDFENQAAQILGQIDALLARCGSDRSRVLTVNIYLKDLSDLSAFNLLWDAWVTPDRLPTRLPIEAKLAASAYLLEIQVVATLRSPKSD